MKEHDFPGCCTATILTGFGECKTADYRLRHNMNTLAVDLKRAEIDAKEDGKAVLLAITNSDQKEARKILRAAGWKRTRALEKDAHPETTITLWWKPMYP